MRSNRVAGAGRDDAGDDIVMVSVTSFRKHLLVEIAVGASGYALVVFAIAANQQWLDRHFLPGFFVTWAQYVRLETEVRAAAAIAGIAIALLLRRPIARALAGNPSRSLSTLLAVLMAFGVSERMLC